eukprot:m.50075 g.50075  ORF g.50075 m.50075 type:complete len:59 (+) comp16256_c0_seq3:954-1130(+)
MVRNQPRMPSVQTESDSSTIGATVQLVVYHRLNNNKRLIRIRHSMWCDITIGHASRLR